MISGSETGHIYTQVWDALVSGYCLV